MATQQVILIALPNGFVERHKGRPDRLKLSMAVALNLLADSNEGPYKLSDTAFADWPCKLAKAKFTVTFTPDPMPAGGRPDPPKNSMVSRMDIGLWEELFGDTMIKVESLNPQVLFERLGKCRTYDASLIHRDIRDTYTAHWSDGNVTGPHPPEVSQAYDALRSFYKVPKKVPQTDLKSPPKADVDVNGHPFFNDRLTHASEFPDVARAIGTVCDFYVDLPKGVDGKMEGTVSISTDFGPVLPRPIAPETAFVLDVGERRFAAASKEKPPNAMLENGMLQFNSGEYELVILDVDHAGLLLDGHRLRPVPSQPNKSVPDPSKSSLPALKSGGLCILDKHRMDRHTQSTSVMKNLHGARLTQQTETYYADSLVRGYRIDVEMSSGGSSAWRTLCARELVYGIGSARTHLKCEDAGSRPPFGHHGSHVYDEHWISLAVTQHDKTADPIYNVHQSIVRWRGWSLAAKRPGKSLPVPPDQARKWTGKLKVKVSPQKGSLPVLRFGYGYRMRARAVDLAGNDMLAANGGVVKPDYTIGGPEGDKDFKDITIGDSLIVGAPRVYKRLEPVSSPVVLFKENPSHLCGETIDHLVLRSNYNRHPDARTERHIVPPRSSQRLAEEHGMFDGPGGGPSPLAFNSIADHDGEFDVKATHFPEPHLSIPYLPDPCASGIALVIETDNDCVLKQFIEFHGLWPDLHSIRIEVVEASEGNIAIRWDWTERVVTIPIPRGKIWTTRLSSTIHASTLGIMEMWDWMAGSDNVTGEAAIQGQLQFLTPARRLVLMHAVQQPLLLPLLSTEAADNRLDVKRELNQTFATICGRVGFHRESTGKRELIGSWTDWLDTPNVYETPRKNPEISVWQDGPDSSNSHGPHEQPMRSVIDTAAVEYANTCSDQEELTVMQTYDQLSVHHNFGDCKHHTVRYTAIATSRFVEQFLPPSEAPAPAVAAGETDGSRADKRIPVTRETPADLRPTVEIPSSARPLAPDPLYVLPMFGWTDREPTRDRNGGFTRQRIGGGLRVYLNRPWYSSGNGELLAVVISPAGKGYFHGSVMSRIANRIQPANLAKELPNDLKSYVSMWGNDPIWGTDKAIDRPLGAQDFKNGTYFVDGYSLDELKPPSPPDKLVTVVGFQPEYDRDRNLWFCDIEMDVASYYMPMVRLALARFQPCHVRVGDSRTSLNDCALSRVVLADFVQLSPTRAATVTFDAPDSGHVTVTVVGTSYDSRWAGKIQAGDNPNAALKGPSAIFATVEERCHPPRYDDLEAWSPVDKTITLDPARKGDAYHWTGQLTIPMKQSLDRYRIRIEEFEEYFDATAQNTVSRLVYADRIQL